ncbi:MAG: 4Fe-4S binding protein [Deltaproteobacteria bacterium]|nr:4Fe-4S binding protein [Deltaproteobacteria bacterium]
MIRKTRIAVQGIFLLIFLWLFLQTESKGLDTLGWPVKIFLDADPLIFLSTALSGRQWPETFWLALLVMAATIFLGRVFCGWICPLGTLHNLVSAVTRQRSKRPSVNLYRWKYYLLIFLLVASLFSLQITGVFDPISLLIRSFSLAVYPAFSYATRATFGMFYEADIPVLTQGTEFIYALLKKLVLPFQQPLYHQGFFVGVLFILVLGLNLVEKRFWCKYLCPLGALLGLCSRYALLKRTVSEGCNECGECASVCQGCARPDEKEKFRIGECFVCMDCDDVCPQNAVRFGFGFKKSAAGLDLGRRRVIGSVLAGIFAAPLFKITPIAKVGASNPKQIRPPGALEERLFLQRCVKCGECMKVCLTGGLQPALFEAGLEGIWSPVLVPRIGYCEYNCTLCGQVCPTGAIKKLSLKEKRDIKIGLAMIDKSRCLPYAHGVPCIVCEEVCPTSKKAIWYEDVKVVNREGNALILKQPHIDLDLCIGCGICEAKCPVIGRPAVTVTSVGESRSKDHQLLLPQTSNIRVKKSFFRRLFDVFLTSSSNDNP